MLIKSVHEVFAALKYILIHSKKDTQKHTYTVTLTVKHESRGGELQTRGP